MGDMLVKLYDLPDPGLHLQRLGQQGIALRRAIAPELHRVVKWVNQRFGSGWAGECQIAFTRQPVSCLIATQDQALLGFACYDATCRAFFGPTGVDEAWRGRGIGSALLLASLGAMADVGYAYAIIGGAGPTDFYSRLIGATPIAGSEPGIYRGMLIGPGQPDPTDAGAVGS